MKRLLTTLAAASLLLAACQEGGTSSGGSGTLKTQNDSVSYSIGLNIGKGMKTDSIDINPDLLARGIKDMMANKPMLSDTQVQNVMMAFQQTLMAKQQERMARQQDSLNKAGEANQKKSDAFLAENKGKPGIKTTASGLQYEVITEGTGPTPKATDNVKVHYKGTLIDGTVFDSSIDRGEPASFNVSGVIPGWTEALQLMKVGSKYRLFIPPAIAYGQNAPPGGKIGPNDALIFEVELLEIVKEGAAGSTPSGGASGGAGDTIKLK